MHLIRTALPSYQEMISCVSHATAGEQFVYEFIPSGIVECQTVKCMCCGEKFTDYVD